MKEMIQQLFEQHNSIEAITGFILFWIWVITMFIAGAFIADSIDKGE